MAHVDERLIPENFQAKWHVVQRVVFELIGLTPFNTMPPKPPATPGHLRPLFRRFLLSVHPDLFSTSPAISKQNEESLAIVLPFFNSLFTDPSSPSPLTDFKNPNAAPIVVFHVKRAKPGDGVTDVAEKGASAAADTAAVRLTLHGHSYAAKVSSVTKL